MRRWWFGIALLAGCYRPATEAACSVHCTMNTGCPGDQMCGASGWCHPPGADICDPTDDARVFDDAPLGDSTIVDLALIDIGGGPPYVFGTGIFTLSQNILPTNDVVLPTLINTTNPTACTVHQPPLGPEVCLIYARTIRDTNGAVRAEGTRPLVLVASETIDLLHGIDAASHVGGVPGAGAFPGDCGLFVNPLPATGGGAGGAAGGSFQGQGGTGGAAGAGTAGAPALATSKPIYVRGGCNGGGGLGGSPPGSGAFGGGAVYLIAASAITLGPNARINVSGAGASNSFGSGNGGGSGGLIGLDAPQFSNQGELMANGGGGSSGYNNMISTAGFDSTAPPFGGLGGTQAIGSGGKGAGGITMLMGLPGAATAANLNAGGGGGGSGYILAYPAGMAGMVNNGRVAPLAI